MFKEGDKVVCVTSTGNPSLAIGGEYVVIGVSPTGNAVDVLGGPGASVQIQGLPSGHFESLRPPAQGMKYDGGKPRWSMLDRLRPMLAQVVLVMEFGAKKYKEDSWTTVPDGLRRYRDARDRHWDAIVRGEFQDVESSLPHWAHMLCGSLFMAWLIANCPELVQAERERHAPNQS